MSIHPSNHLYRFLDTNGDGSGTKNANGLYAAAAEEFYIQPQPGKVYRIERMIVEVEDTTAMQAQEYGNLGAALTNGIKVSIKHGDTEVIDLTDGVNIKTNANWGRVCYDSEIRSWGAGDEFLHVRWTFAKSGEPIVLEGVDEAKLVVTLNDDLDGLLSHYFHVQGFRLA